MSWLLSFAMIKLMIKSNLGREGFVLFYHLNSTKGNWCGNGSRDHGGMNTPPGLLHVMIWMRLGSQRLGYLNIRFPVGGNVWEEHREVGACWRCVSWGGLWVPIDSQYSQSALCFLPSSQDVISQLSLCLCTAITDSKLGEPKAQTMHFSFVS